MSAIVGPVLSQKSMPWMCRIKSTEKHKLHKKSYTLATLYFITMGCNWMSRYVHSISSVLQIVSSVSLSAKWTPNLLKGSSDTSQVPETLPRNNTSQDASGFTPTPHNVRSASDAHTTNTLSLTVYRYQAPEGGHYMCQSSLPYFPAKPCISAKATELPDFKGYVELQTSYMMYSFTDAMRHKNDCKCLYI